MLFIILKNWICWFLGKLANFNQKLQFLFLIVFLYKILWDIWPTNLIISVFKNFSRAVFVKKQIISFELINENTLITFKFSQYFIIFLEFLIKQRNVWHKPLDKVFKNQNEQLFKTLVHRYYVQESCKETIYIFSLK